MNCVKMMREKLIDLFVIYEDDLELTADKEWKTPKENHRALNELIKYEDERLSQHSNRDRTPFVHMRRAA